MQTFIYPSTEVLGIFDLQPFSSTLFLFVVQSCFCENICWTFFVESLVWTWCQLWPSSVQYLQREGGLGSTFLPWFVFCAAMGGGWFVWHFSLTWTTGTIGWLILRISTSLVLVEILWFFSCVCVSRTCPLKSCVFFVVQHTASLLIFGHLGGTAQLQGTPWESWIVKILWAFRYAYQSMWWSCWSTVANLPRILLWDHWRRLANLPRILLRDHWRRHPAAWIQYRSGTWYYTIMCSLFWSSLWRATFYTRVDTPFSSADVYKALFEARLQSLGDTELTVPWESGMMGNIFLNLMMLQVCRHCLQSIWALEIRCTQLYTKMLLHLPHRGSQEFAVVSLEAPPSNCWIQYRLELDTIQSCAVD